MDSTRRDFFVGLFLLVSVGVIVGGLVLTSRILERRIPIYVRMDSGEGISQDTRVVLQGLPIGRVTQITPHVDAATLAVTFVARLDVREAFPDGTVLQLPVGTEAVIEQPPAPIGQTEIRLEFPERTPSQAVLQPGDTINSTRSRELLEALDQVVDELREEIFLTLGESRRLIGAVVEAVHNTTDLMDTTRPSVLAALERLNTNLEASESLIADIQPRIGPLYDSLTATLGDTRQLLARVQTITDTTEVLISDTRDPIRTSLARIERTLEILEHFADQVSRRPTRMLTGVRPPPPDTTGGNP